MRQPQEPLIKMSKESLNDKNQKFCTYLTPLGAWALAFGWAVGWGAFVMPGNTFLPIAGPIGTALGIALGSAVSLVEEPCFFLWETLIRASPIHNDFIY